jgi:hypothetical protein
MSNGADTPDSEGILPARMATMRHIRSLTEGDLMADTCVEMNRSSSYEIILFIARQTFGIYTHSKHDRREEFGCRDNDFQCYEKSTALIQSLHQELNVFQPELKNERSVRPSLFRGTFAS